MEQTDPALHVRPAGGQRCKASKRRSIAPRNRTQRSQTGGLKGGQEGLSISLLAHQCTPSWRNLLMSSAKRAAAAHATRERHFRRIAACNNQRSNAQQGASNTEQRQTGKSRIELRQTGQDQSGVSEAEQMVHALHRTDAAGSLLLGAGSHWVARNQCGQVGAGGLCGAGC
jgi:hypothetical protein